MTEQRRGAGATAGRPDPDPVSRALQALGPECAGPWYVGVSGGLDSMVLLHAASLRARALDLPLTALHINHQLHPHASDWAQQVQAAAAALGVPAVVETVSVSARGSQEAAARRARYARFEAQLAAGGTLLLAQHADDQLENILLGVLRGRGGAELTMPGQRPLGSGWVRRPLLALPRQALSAYARRHGISFSSDPANADPRHDRNHVRSLLLPRLLQRFAARTRLPAFAARAAADAHLARQLGQLDLQAVRRAGAGDWDLTRLAHPLDVPRLRALEPLRARNALRCWLIDAGAAEPAERSLAELVAQLAARPDAQPCVNIGALQLRRHADTLYMLPVALPMASAEPVPLERSAGEVTWSAGRLTWQHSAADPLALSATVFAAPIGPLVVRPRRPGEQLRVAGRGHVALGKLLAEAGVPPWWREHLPVIAGPAGALLVPGVAITADLAAAAGSGGWQFRWHPDGPAWLSARVPPTPRRPPPT